MEGRVTACMAAWLSVKIVTPSQFSSSWVIWSASSRPTSSAEYTVDFVLSPRYLVFFLPALGHHAAAPTWFCILLPSVYMRACVAVFFIRQVLALCSPIAASFVLAVCVSGGSHHGLVVFVYIGSISSCGWPVIRFEVMCSSSRDRRGGFLLHFRLSCVARFDVAVLYTGLPLIR